MFEFVCTLLSGLSVREFASFASCFVRRGELAHRIASRHRATRRAPHRQVHARLPRRFRPDIVVSFGVSLEMKLANQAVAEHARAEGEGRARSGLHAE